MASTPVRVAKRAHIRWALRPLTLALIGAAPTQAQAQSHLPSDDSATVPAQTVTVTGRAAPDASAVTGFADVTPSRTPLQASTVTADQLQDAGVTQLSGLTKLDASVNDDYNAVGYWSYLSVRGYTLDNRYNYLRDGLPINAETSLGLDNKASVDILKGLSGMQAGTSAPGGLVNLVVKRPDVDRRDIGFGWTQSGTYGAHADISQRFGADGAAGLRLNAAVERLDPQVRDAQGHRHLLALAGDARLGDAGLLEAEVEISHQSQPSVPGFSLLGNRLPSAHEIDPRINLNNQPWSSPVVLDGQTASLRWTRALAADWTLTAQALVQRLTSDDRLAYPFGCSKEDTYDRYCSDGTFDFYDFHSDHEHRDTDDLKLQAAGSVATGAFIHHLTLGVLSTRFRSRLQPQVDDGTIVGSGSVDGLTVIPTLPDLATVPNTDTTERSTELFLRDHVALSGQTGLWAGLRHTQLQRSSIQTDGGDPTHYDQAFTTPWLALTQRVTPQTLAYASWGQGVESEVAPNLVLYTNAGQPLPALKSHQTELGLKHDSAGLAWSVTGFDIQRPLFDDVGACDTAASCTHQIDGREHHRGIEVQAQTRIGRWYFTGSAMWLNARREGGVDTSLNGLRPPNVPKQTLKLQAGRDVAALPGLTLLAALTYEGQRAVLPDNSISLPGWTQIDLGARYITATRYGQTVTWRLAVDNAANQRAWRESPYQYDHVYLFPLAPRTWRASVDFSF
jgi:iron complex outermembrane receptor protein